MEKTLHVPYIADLDFLNTDAIFNRLESSGERHTIEEINWKDRFPYHPLTTFTIAHSDRYIYINFFVRCNYLRAVNFENNTPVDEDSCVGLFVETPGDGNYLSFFINCIGTINAAKCKDGNILEQLSDDKIARISVLPSCGKRPFEEIEGLFTWDILAAIPMEVLGIEYKGGPLELKGNFYKCATGTSQPHFVSWSPIHSANPDFYHPESFGKIVLD